MSVILVTAKFKFRNRSTCSKEPMKRAGKVCGDSQDLKSPGSDDNVINLCMIKFLWWHRGGGLSCFGGNSKICLKTRGN